jgi:hypothetical protein
MPKPLSDEMEFQYWEERAVGKDAPVPLINGGAVKPSITRGACPAYRPSQLAHEAVGPPFRCTGPYAECSCARFP